MFCTQCGANNSEESRFCAKCGAAMAAQANAPAGPAAAPATAGGAISAARPSSVPNVAAGAPTAPPAMPPGQPFAQPPFAGPVESSGKAIASLVCGILFFFFPTAIVAIVLGHLALSDIRKAAGRLTGRGMAIAGLVLGYMGVAVIPFVLIVAAIAIPNLLRARMAANEATAVESLHIINTTNVTYASTFSNGYAPSLAALGGPVGTTQASCDHALLIDPGLASGQKNGYVFTYAPLPPANGSAPALSPEAARNGCTVPGSPAGYSVRADPVERGTTGQRSFYTDQDGTIRFEDSGAATGDSQPLE
jgi:type IV pilus assembly protein PilA